MKQLGIVLVFGLGVGVGCAAGTAVQTQVAEAQARGGWEVTCNKSVSQGAMEKKGNALGSEGWEPFSFDGNWMCFKRPLP